MVEDLKTAFDYVERKELLRFSKKNKVESEILKWIMRTYSKNSSVVILNYSEPLL